LEVKSGATCRKREVKNSLREGHRRGFHLCGITRIDGYVIDKENHDIILIGETDPKLPTLYLDDFVVALRNVWLKYAKLKGKFIDIHLRAVL